AAGPSKATAGRRSRSRGGGGKSGSKTAAAPVKRRPASASRPVIDSSAACRKKTKSSVAANATGSVGTKPQEAEPASLPRPKSRTSSVSSGSSCSHSCGQSTSCSVPESEARWSELPALKPLVNPQRLRALRLSSRDDARHGETVWQPSQRSWKEAVGGGDATVAVEPSSPLHEMAGQTSGPQDPDVRTRMDASSCRIAPSPTERNQCNSRRRCLSADEFGDVADGDTDRSTLASMALYDEGAATLAASASTPLQPIYQYSFRVPETRANMRAFCHASDRRVEAIARACDSEILLDPQPIRTAAASIALRRITVRAPDLHSLEKCCRMFDDKFPQFYASSGLGPDGRGIKNFKFTVIENTNLDIVAGGSGCGGCAQALVNPSNRGGLRHGHHVWPLLLSFRRAFHVSRALVDDALALTTALLPTRLRRFFLIGREALPEDADGQRRRQRERHQEGRGNNNKSNFCGIHLAGSSGQAQQNSGIGHKVQRVKAVAKQVNADKQGVQVGCEQGQIDQHCAASCHGNRHQRVQSVHAQREAYSGADCSGWRRAGRQAASQQVAELAPLQQQQLNSANQSAKDADAADVQQALVPPDQVLLPDIRQAVQGATSQYEGVAEQRRWRCRIAGVLSCQNVSQGHATSAEDAGGNADVVAGLEPGAQEEPRADEGYRDAGAVEQLHAGHAGKVGLNVHQSGQQVSPPEASSGGAQAGGPAEPVERHGAKGKAQQQVVKKALRSRRVHAEPLQIAGCYCRAADEQRQQLAERQRHQQPASCRSVAATAAAGPVWRCCLISSWLGSRVHSWHWRGLLAVVHHWRPERTVEFVDAPDGVSGRCGCLKAPLPLLQLKTFESNTLQPQQQAVYFFSLSVGRFSRRSCRRGSWGFWGRRRSHSPWRRRRRLSLLDCQAGAQQRPGVPVGLQQRGGVSGQGESSLSPGQAVPGQSHGTAAQVRLGGAGGQVAADEVQPACDGRQPGWRVANAVHSAGIGTAGEQTVH
uniref:HECT domain-containing protein n=1 Tax=Macrostomum lignano TaxID=282301 RepID=A0A1I8HCQ3_9PLAT